MQIIQCASDIDLHRRTIFNIRRKGVITSLFECERRSEMMRIAIASMTSCSKIENIALEEMSRKGITMVS